jgi:protein required for attachment to host cells
VQNLKSIHPVTWFVVASRTDAVFYYDGDDHKFHFINRLSNPLGNEHERELDSDRPGSGVSSAAGGTIRHALDRRSFRHERVAETFARKIADSLESSLNEKRFSSLVLVAEPHFLGLLRSALPEAVSQTIKNEVGREYPDSSDAEIRERIFRILEN